MNGYKSLSSSIVNKYDYMMTKKKVDQFMAPLCEKIYEYRNLTPPSITAHIKDIVVQESHDNISPQERYVIKKLDTQEEVEKYFEVIQSIIDLLNDVEKLCFKAEYLSELTMDQLVDKTRLSDITIKRIRKSCIIKFALALDLAVMKRK